MRNLKARKVANQLVGAKPLSKKTIKNITEVFYRIMRENDIKQGEYAKDMNSRVIANPEWTMCKALFLENIHMTLNMAMIIDVPDDLLGYTHKKS